MPPSCGVQLSRGQAAGRGRMCRGCLLCARPKAGWQEADRRPQPRGGDMRYGVAGTGVEAHRTGGGLGPS